MTVDGYQIPESEPESDPVDQAPSAGQTSALQQVGIPTEVKTGFVILLTKDGQWVGSSSLVDGKFPPIHEIAVDKEATVQEMMHGAQAIAGDAQIMITSQFTANFMAQQAHAAMERQTQALEAKRIVDKIKQGGPHPYDRNKLYRA